MNRFLIPITDEVAMSLVQVTIMLATCPNCKAQRRIRKWVTSVVGDPFCDRCGEKMEHEFIEDMDMRFVVNQTGT